MKYLLFGFTLGLQSIFCFGQITLEKKYSSGDLCLVNLEGEGRKYLLENVTYSNNYKSSDVTIKLYNQDHSIFKTIKTPTINLSGKETFWGFFVVDPSHVISNVSNKLFNNNSNIEFALSRTIYDTLGGIRRFVKIMDENGSTILDLDSCVIGEFNSGHGYGLTTDFPWLNGVFKMDNGLKLFIYSNRLSDGALPTGPAKVIYSLPGTYVDPLALDENKLPNQDKALLSAPMPNPSSETTRIEFQLPTEASFGEIMVYNTMGLRVKSYKVDNAFGDLLLNNSDLSSGNYTYQLIAGGKRIGSQKMMIIK